MERCAQCISSSRNSSSSSGSSFSCRPSCSNISRSSCIASTAVSNHCALVVVKNDYSALIMALALHYNHSAYLMNVEQLSAVGDIWTTPIS